MHLNDLAKYVKIGINKNEAIGLIFNPIGVSDGISIVTSGMVWYGMVWYGKGTWFTLFRL
jgi:dihydroxyacid dehydratase/phosphogluconate dehydratase